MTKEPAFGWIGALALLMNPLVGVAKALPSLQYQQNAWTNDVSINTRYFTDSSISYQKSAVSVSPDGKFVVVHSKNGDINCYCTHQRIDVFSVDAILRWLSNTTSPNELAPTQSLIGTVPSPKSWAFQQVGWEGSSRNLIFLGRDGQGATQIRRWNVESGVFTTLTSAKNIGPKFEVRGGGILYSENQPFSSPRTKGVILPMARDENGDIKLLMGELPEQSRLYSSYNGQPGRPTDIAPMFAPNLWLSPSGRYAIVAPTIPTAGNFNPPEPQVFSLIDLSLNKTVHLMNIGHLRPAAVAWPGHRSVVWSNDEKSVIIVNGEWSHGVKSLLPDSESPVGEIRSYNIGDKKWDVLEGIPDPESPTWQISGRGWLKEGVEYLVTHTRNGIPAKGALYTYRKGRWIRTWVSSKVALPKKAFGKLPNGLSVEIRQDASTPANVWASAGGISKPLFEPDVSLSGFKITPQNRFVFSLADGTQVVAGLMLPKNAAGRVPLVIELGKYEPNLFLPAGRVPAGFAPQTFAANGYAVLELDLTYPEHVPEGTYEAANRLASRKVDAAIKTLSEKGLIDPKKVGLIGQSYGGAQVFYLITHPGQYPAAAAQSWDGAIKTFTSYLEAAVNGGFIADEESINGMTRFWDAKERWLQNDHLFNIDKVRTPTLFTVHSTGFKSTGQFVREERYDSTMTIGAFKIMKKPIEYVVIPDAAHAITSPREHKAAMDLSLDWMNFWLLGREDPAPEKQAQYKRWRPLRAQQVASEADAKARDLGGRNNSELRRQVQ